MKRRAFVTSMLAGAMAAPVAAGGQHQHQSLDGPLANATASFGAWPANPATPFDRMTQPPPPPPPPNHHAMVPSSVTIKAGGTVNFIIAGLHQVQVYAPGTTPDEVLAAALAGGTISIGAGLPPVVDVPDQRVFRGIVNPAAPDRVEVVHFPSVGTYLVICGILPHLEDGMFGWVKVIS